ncbi:SDR family NAD(P)-dependent oxidoreductase [Halomarina ordinaria]|uniref:SDR family NAD(P)-dependent oxidoreductase n=1 Tax=Halomarina ordinaria TaxID=3033939 RepID=A0ABD5UBQ6_9EURY|nr:SDR family NAD(P)-dependent oxidoreductase [Halomarina sp. PSRA2]
MDETTGTMAGKIVVLTGATSGIGRVAARRLGERGATVVLTGRDRERGRAALREVREAGGDGRFVRADVADLDAVRSLADVVRERYDRLDVLVHNAALSLSSRRTVDLGGRAVEAVFLVNHLAPFLLTYELVDLLVASAPARVVVTASSVHRRGELALSDLALDDEYDALDAYARSKLANVLFTVELADRLAGTGVTANAYHPGFVPGSGLYRDTSLPLSLAVRLAARLPFVGTSVAEGAAGLVALAADAPADLTGAYVAGRSRETPDDRAHDAARRERLWNASADLVGVPRALPLRERG